MAKIKKTGTIIPEIKMTGSLSFGLSFTHISYEVVIYRDLLVFLPIYFDRFMHLDPLDKCCYNFIGKFCYLRILFYKVYKVLRSIGTRMEQSLSGAAPPALLPACWP